MKTNISRRNFIHQGVTTIASLAALGSLSSFEGKKNHEMKLGFVTYLWGKDWDLATLIANCEKSGLKGVELRTQHAHGVEISLSKQQRAEVRKRFADSGVTCIGYGSNYEFHSPDQAVVRTNIDGAKEYIKLCRDIGASGIKVKPNNLPAEVPKEKTIAQIAASLNELGRFASDYGQIVRLEAHGALTQEIPNMRAIFDQVTEPAVKLCWNSNDVDLNSPGLAGNFKLVSKWIGDTVHVRGFRISDYPYLELINLLKGINYNGWVLIEAATEPKDKLEAMREQLTLFEELLKNS